MDRTKQRLTQFGILLSVIITLSAYMIFPRYLVSVLAGVLCSWFIYRITLRYTRSCPYCRVWWNPRIWLSTKRRHEVEPYGHVLSRKSLCTTWRICGNRHCSHYGKDEEAKPSYLKEFRSPHRRALQSTWLS